MGNLNSIVDMLKICLWLGVIIVCIILVISGILRWLAAQGNTEERRKKLNISGWIAFVVLTAMIFYSRRESVTEFFCDNDGSKALTSVVVNGSKMAVKLLLLGTAFAIVAIVSLVVILLVSKGIRATLDGQNKSVKDWAKKLKEVGNQFSEIVRTPIFTFFVTCGILLAFILLPFLLGNSEDKVGLAETWGNGVQKFVSVIYKNEAETKNDSGSTDNNVNTEGGINSNRNTEPNENENVPSGRNSGYSKDLSISDVITYILVYIIVLGVGFAVTRILYAIVRDNLKQKHSISLIDEYSGSMGIMGVGVSILLVLHNIDIYQNEPLDVVLAFLKYFAIVAIAMTLAIVMLEIIRLVMDMRETLIRREARYLFVALVGQASLLILVLLDSIFSALNSAVGQGREDMDISYIQNKLIRNITKTMEQEINRETDDRDVTFTIFKTSITKK